MPVSLRPSDFVDEWPEWDRCPGVLPLINTVTGRAEYVPKPCSKWYCRECAPKRASEYQNAAYEWFYGQSQIWHGRYSFRGQSTLAAVRKRRERAGKVPGLWVERSDALYVYSTQELGGENLITRTGTWLTPLAAGIHLRLVSLNLPGVWKAKSAGSWKIKHNSQTPSGTRTAPLGVISQETADFIGEYIRKHGGTGNPTQTKELMINAYQEYRKLLNEPEDD